jgi:acetyl esterase/lipase
MTRSSIVLVAPIVLASLLTAGPALGQQPPPTAYTMTAVDTAHGDREFHLLWPDGVPGAVGTEAVDKPKITVYLAPADRATGAAVVVCPGGGYRVVAADHEGRQIAEWLNSLGVSAFVLQYRLGERYRHPAPLQDAQRAIRMVRSRAKVWRVDPKRVGILGFSAGGHLASTAATHFDDGRPDAADPIEREGSRPDFAVLCYAVISLVDPVAHAGSRRFLLGDTAPPHSSRS